MFKDTPCGSSFGAIGHITPASANRLKGFIGTEGTADNRITKITTDEDITNISATVALGIERVKDGAGYSRLSLRMFVSERMLERFSQEIERIGASVEAIIPIRNGDCRMVYVGYNSEDRTTERSTLESYLRRIDEVRTGTLIGGQKTAPETMSIEIINDRSTPTFTSNLVTMRQMLMNAFGYSHGVATSTLMEETNTIAVIRSEGKIAGMCIAERRQITVMPNERIELAEVTDAHVLPEYQGNGFYNALSMELVNHLKSTGVHLIFTESNVTQESMLRTIAKQDRVVAGILPKHAMIEGGLRDLVVTYFRTD